MTTNRRERQCDDAILPDGRINLSRIEREISNGMTEEDRFSAEDSMKKRAVHMSRDYDEFKNFVSASQLKPVQSSEMGELFVQRQLSNFYSTKPCSKRRGPNKVCKEKKKNFLRDFHDPSKFGAISITDSKRNQQSLKAKQSTVPRNASELEREWRKWCKSPSSTLEYLFLPFDFSGNVSTEDLTSEEVKESHSVPIDLRLSPESVARLCTIEMDLYIMESVLEALHYYITVLLGTDHDSTKESATRDIQNVEGIQTCVVTWEFVYRWMMSFTKCGRFDLNVDFMEAKHKNLISSILGHLKKQAENCKEQSFTCENITSLKNKYRI